MDSIILAWPDDSVTTQIIEQSRIKIYQSSIAGQTATNQCHRHMNPPQERELWTKANFWNLTLLFIPLRVWEGNLLRGTGTRSILWDFGFINVQSTIMGKSWFVKPQLTLDILEDLLLWNIDPFHGFANLFLPKRYKFIDWVCVFRRPNVQNFVQGSWVIHCSYRIAGNVFFHVINCCIFARWDTASKSIKYWRPQAHLREWQQHTAVMHISTPIKLLLPFALPSPKMTTLSLGGALAASPGWHSAGRK